MGEPSAPKPLSLWPVRLRLAEVQRRPPAWTLEADPQVRGAIARTLDLLALDRFAAQVSVTPWLDGAQIDARWQADIRQTCGVSLEPFDTPLSGAFVVRVAPMGSPAIAPETAEVSIDPEAEDPPDVLEGEDIDVGAYLVEHLALEVDPFPRKPGVAFEPPPPEAPASPFAVLLRLKPDPDDGDEGRGDG